MQRRALINPPYSCTLYDNVSDRIMSSRNENDDDVASRLAGTHISATSSVEDLVDTESAHKAALASAKANHQRVLDTALRVYSNDVLRKKQEVLQRAQTRELERLRLESENAQLAVRLQELQRKKITPPAPRAPSPPPPPIPSPKSITSPRTTSAQNLATNGQNVSFSHQLAEGRPPSRRKTPPPISEHPKSIPSPLEPPKPPPLLSKPASLPPPSQAINKIPIDQASDVKVQNHDPLARLPFPEADKYIEIHKRLKKVRSFVLEHGKQDQGLKKKTGEMRREIRKSVGQLTGGRGANRTPMGKIVDTLKEALNISSPPIDPGMFVLTAPAPIEGAQNNDSELPILYIYLLNIFSKAVIAQFIDEAGVSPKAADPIGVVAVSVFAQADLCWRGVSLIDILICKMRVVCPVLFGIRGNEKTEEGRARLGWWRGEGGEWVSDHIHNTRMTGLGAGYAAISLRDFSKSSNTNPYPPTKYWQSLARIVNTPSEETSSTQYIVLKAMIENYEQRFMTFYGSAARAALQVALVDFSGRAPEATVAVTSLKVLGDKLRRDVGLKLQPSSVSKS